MRRISIILPAAASGMLMSVIPASAAIIFQDTFDLGSSTQNLNTGILARQSAGTVGSTYSWTQTGGHNYKTQIFNTSLGLGIDGNNGNTLAGLNTSITGTHLSGGYFYIETSMSPFTFSDNGNVPSDAWTSIRFGQNSYNNFVNSSNPGMGMLINLSGGVTLFDGSNAVGSGTVGSAGFHSFDIRLKDAADNNPFDGSATVMLVEVYADNGPNPIITYNRASNFANNIVTFGHYSSHNNSSYDFGGVDIVTMGTAVPEFGSLALLGLAIPSLMLRRRR